MQRFGDSTAMPTRATLFGRGSCTRRSRSKPRVSTSVATGARRLRRCRWTTNSAACAGRSLPCASSSATWPAPGSR
nr:MAG TPA: hypothetical protein [Bacteriophage sp.]